jgi:hypothetical protein
MGVDPALWEKLGLKQTIADIVKAKKLRMPYERALMAMTANRLCDPDSKLGVWDRWLSTVYLPSCKDLKLKHMYEAMDLLHEHAVEVEKTIFFNTANLFNLEVDLIFYDTTTASFSVDQEDDPHRHANATLRKFGHSKDGTWTPASTRRSSRASGHTTVFFIWSTFGLSETSFASCANLNWSQSRVRKTLRSPSM